jgi:hypothetical protein
MILNSSSSSLHATPVVVHLELHLCLHSISFYPFLAQIHRLSEAKSIILELDFTMDLVENYQQIFGKGAHLDSQHGPNFKCAQEFSALLEGVSTSFLTKIHSFGKIRQRAFFRGIRTDYTGQYDPFRRLTRSAGAGRIALIVSLGALGLSGGNYFTLVETMTTYFNTWKILIGRF